MPGKQDPLFEVAAESFVAASPGDAYRVFSDLRNSPLWSIECTGGDWTGGEPGAVGSVFRGDNVRSGDVVPWAPVVRGRWSTYAEVVAAVPGRRFAWAMRDDAGRAQDSVWSFTVAAALGGCLLAHRFRMGRPTEGIRKITAGMTDADRARFFREWAAKLAHDLSETVHRLKAALERQPATVPAGATLGLRSATGTGEA
ncbi:SRPBCC family protein [Actinoplanes sp. NPDC049265]|uniref:SRPBCC family protein n=1 Tax=Actinoplanes sp. NPDC049265 TaxID=3363902 RepID=UPI0037121A4E